MSLNGVGTPTGTVLFKIDGRNYGAPLKLNSGTASISDAALHVGPHTITAVYTPASGNFVTSTAANFKQAVGYATTTAVASSVKPSSFGQSVTFKATVANASPHGSGTPAGRVQFKIDGRNYGAAVTLSGGKASISDTALPAGAHTITAVYTPASGNFVTSTSAILKQTVSADATTTAVTSTVNPSSFGQSVIFKATVANASKHGAGTPTGTVLFKIDGSNYGSPVKLSGGKASISDAALHAGTHVITAVYKPANGNFVTSTSAKLKQVVKAAASTMIAGAVAVPAGPMALAMTSPWASSAATPSRAWSMKTSPATWRRPVAQATPAPR
jgi:hypothetical protein